MSYPRRPPPQAHDAEVPTSTAHLPLLPANVPLTSTTPPPWTSVLEPAPTPILPS